MKVKQINGSYARDNDGQRCGEAFQYIVSVFDNHGYDQSSARLQDNQVANEQIVAEEKALSTYNIAIL